RGHGIQCLCPAEIPAIVQGADAGLSRHTRPEYLAARQQQLTTDLNATRGFAFRQPISPRASRARVIKRQRRDLPPPLSRIDMFSRRHALKAALSGLVAASGTSAIAASGAGLDRPAIFGAAVRPGLVDSDADYSRALRKYCSAIV